MVKVLIADKNYLSRVALELLVGELKGFDLVPSVCGDKADLINQLKLSKPNLVIADSVALGINAVELKQICSKFKKTNFLIITEALPKNELSNLLDSGITSYLLKECDKAEIMDAINSTIKDQKFICGKIVSILTSAPELTVTNTLIKKIGCDGMHVTERETEIIKAIAEGLSNKLIADKLNLSTHTVNTHRKNIMQKLGVNNTAGVVMFAVKNNLLETNFSF
ncbi:MAG: response regulator transcription factor [Bacteroidetes bacterium]|jgi:two-component system invasion response regulator UvrY|nr:response regulator transcription factor [Bacteroidota bacterium]MCA6445241.1 response regulator transcription factor [Bacteroidota bacterium]